jgi:hypothetical protein
MLVLWPGLFFQIVKRCSAEVKPWAMFSAKQVVPAAAQRWVNDEPFAPVWLRVFVLCIQAEWSAAAWFNFWS